MPLLAVLLNVYQTIWPPVEHETNASKGTSPYRFLLGPERARGFRTHLRSSGSLGFVLFCVGAFALTGAMKISAVLLDTIQLQFTWFTAMHRDNIYGFFVMAMFGAIYYILPNLAGVDFPRPKLVRAHFWLAAAGIALQALPQAIGGVIQAVQLDSAVPFSDITHTMLHFLRVSTIGDLLLLAGNLVFL